MASTCNFTFDETRHAYLDALGVVIPSVTQRLKAAGLIDFSMVHPAVLERKARLGTLVHQAAEFIDRGESLEDFDVPDEVMEYLPGYINFKGDCGFTPDLIEHGLIAEVHGMRYGMRVDRTGPINGVPYVIELKCGAVSSPTWGVQLSAYDMGLPKPLPHGHHKRAAVQLGPQFPRGYKVHPYEDPADSQIWLSVLALTNWKLNKHLFVTEDVPERLVA